MYSKRAIANEFTEPVNTDTNVLRVLVYLSYLTVGDVHSRLGIREDDHGLVDREFQAHVPNQSLIPFPELS